MYGTQTTNNASLLSFLFENDVKMYGTQTLMHGSGGCPVFENDVKMYGTQQQTMTQEYV